MVEIAREVCGSVRVGGKNPKSMWWNYKDETTVRRKDVVWKVGIMGSTDNKIL